MESISTYFEQLYKIDLRIRKDSDIIQDFFK